MTIITAVEGQKVRIGKQGEKGVTRVLIPCMACTSVTLLHRRRGDAHPYAATVSTITYEGSDYVAWDIAAADTAVAGIGEMDVSFYNGSTIAKTVTYSTVVDKAVEDGEISVPTAAATWVQTVADKTAAATAAAASAASSAEVLICRPIHPVFEIGAIRNQYGTDMASDKHVRSARIVIDDDYMVSFGSGAVYYSYYIYYYKADGSYDHYAASKACTTATSIAAEGDLAGGAFRIVIKRNDGEAIDEQDIANIKAAIKVQCLSHLRDRMSLCVTPEMFGAFGNGADDDTDAIQAALDVGGLVCLDSARKYKITDTLKITKSGTVFDGNGATIVNGIGVTTNAQNAAVGKPVITATGSAGTAYDITADVTSKDGNSATVTIDHTSGETFAVGDYVALQSCRNALGQQSGMYWCGTTTRTASPAYWTEILTVNKRQSATQIKCTGTLTYPYYLASRESGVDPAQDAEGVTPPQHSTVRKVSFLSDVKIRNLTIESDSGAQETDNTIEMILCRDSNVEGVNIKKSGTARGRAFILQNCLRCAFDGCSADSAAVYTSGSGASKLLDNHFTFASSWSCSAVGCKSIHGGQAFDTTYGNSTLTDTHIRCPSFGITVTGCTVTGSADSAATNHSGSWGVSYIDCDFIGCAKPLCVRSPSSLIMGCRFRMVSGTTDTYAIEIAEPTTFGTRVIGNSVVGSKGLKISNSNSGRSAEPSELLSVLGILISGNDFTDTVGGITVERYSEWVRSNDLGIVITDNIFRGCMADPTLILDDSRCNGVTFKDNTLIGCDCFYDEESRTGDKHLVRDSGTNVALSGNALILCGKTLTGD